jgi:hypothetical protein
MLQQFEPHRLPHIKQGLRRLDIIQLLIQLWRILMFNVTAALVMETI